MDPNNEQAQQPQGGKGKTLAIVSLVLGIVGAVICWFGWSSILALICGIVGIVLAVKARNLCPVGQDGRNLATAGLVLSIIAVALSGITVVCWICALAGATAIAAGAGAGALSELGFLAIL